VLPFALERLAQRPASTTQLRAAIAERFPGLPAAALAYACRCRLPLVQVPPRGVWGRSSQVALAPLEAWVGRPLDHDASLDRVVVRYLAGFGPATVADVAAWCRLTRLRPVVERLRPELRTFTDDRGRELFDLPDAPRPSPDEPAPVRFLPEYDNVLLSHADRSRFRCSDGWDARAARGPVKGTALVDGTVAAVWHPVHDPASGCTSLIVEHRPLPARDRDDLAAEGLRTARFRYPDAAAHDVHLLPVS
jgi:hypothetical protein